MPMWTCRDVATYTNWWWCEESAEWFVECKEDDHPWKQIQHHCPGYQYLYHIIDAVNTTYVSTVAIAAGTAAVGVGALELSVT